MAGRLALGPRGAWHSAGRAPGGPTPPRKAHFPRSPRQAGGPASARWRRAWRPVRRTRAGRRRAGPPRAGAGPGRGLGVCPCGRARAPRGPRACGRQQPRRPRVGRHHLLTRSALPSPRSGRGVGSSRNFELGKFFSLKETRNLPTERPSSINGVCWVTFMSVLLNALELMPPRGASLENSFDQPSSFR